VTCDCFVFGIPLVRAAKFSGLRDKFRRTVQPRIVRDGRTRGVPVRLRWHAMRRRERIPYTRCSTRHSIEEADDMTRRVTPAVLLASVAPIRATSPVMVQRRMEATGRPISAGLCRAARTRGARGRNRFACGLFPDSGENQMRTGRRCRIGPTKAAEISKRAVAFRLPHPRV
jgi:hypothetical protein